MKKRLRHHADAILGILTGYQMSDMYQHFSRYGQGIYEFDYRKNELKFMGTIVEPIPILSWINEWFINELSKYNFESEAFFETVVKIDIYKQSSQTSTDAKKILFWTFYVPREVPTYLAKYDVIIKTSSGDFSKSASGEIN